MPPGDIQGSSQPGDTTADYQGVLLCGEPDWVERLE
jgi:hypothetical protein